MALCTRTPASVWSTSVASVGSDVRRSPDGTASKFNLQLGNGRSSMVAGR